MEEGFFGTLKKERVYRKEYRTREEAKADGFDYVERFYNSNRRHSRSDTSPQPSSKGSLNKLKVVSGETWSFQGPRVRLYARYSMSGGQTCRGNMVRGPQIDVEMSFRFTPAVGR